LRTDAKLKFVDSNNNLVWDSGETVVYDANSNGQYDQADPVISGPVPAVGTILRTDVKLSYVDSNSDSLWEIGEPVVYDSNANGSYDSVEPLIATFIAPSVNSTL